MPAHGAGAHVWQVSQRPEEIFMCGDGKESYRVPAVMYSEDVIRYITSVCNGCSSHGNCEIAKSFSVLDRCENFRSRALPLVQDGRQHSVFVFPSTPLYHSITQELPNGTF